MVTLGAYYGILLDPASCGHWGSWVELVSRYQKFILRNGDGLEGKRTGRVYTRDENCVCQEVLYRPLGIGAESKRRPQ